MTTKTKNAVTVGEVDCAPAVLFYTNGREDDLQMGCLQLDPSERTVSYVMGDPHSSLVPERIWNGQVLCGRPDFPVDAEPGQVEPDEQKLREYLEGIDAQALLIRVCDGHEIIYNGRGLLTVDAQHAWDMLLTGIANMGWSSLHLHSLPGEEEADDDDN